MSLGVRSAGGAYVINYILFVVFSVSPSAPLSRPYQADSIKVLFAVCASLLVTSYSVFAKQSGIPEIKTVLGGFVIRRFMGTWTLIIKSLGLVRILSCLALGIS